MYYTFQSYITGVNQFFEPRGKLNKVKGKQEWQCLTRNVFKLSISPRKNGEPVYKEVDNEMKDVFEHVGYLGFWDLTKAIAALNRLRVDTMQGKHDVGTNHGIMYMQRRYSFRIIKVIVFQKTIIPMEDL